MNADEIKSLNCKLSDLQWNAEKIYHLRFRQSEVTQHNTNLPDIIAGYLQELAIRQYFTYFFA